MAGRKRSTDSNDADSDEIAPKRPRGSENKGPAAAAAQSQVAAASSLVAAAPSGAATAVAAAPSEATTTAADKGGTSKTTPSPDDLYAQGMHYLSIKQESKAMCNLYLAAEGNHIEAAFRYALVLYRSNYQQQAASRYQRILPLLKGHSNEAVLTGRLYRHLGEVLQCESRQRALPYFQQGVLLGNPKCQYYFGLYLDEGSGLSRDVRAASHWYRLAAAAGSRRASIDLGLPLSMFPAPAQFLVLSDAHPLLF